MSVYVKEKVLRIPVTELSFYVQGSSKRDTIDKLEEENKDLFGYAKVGKFQSSPTMEYYLDYLIEREYDSDASEYGKIRKLYDLEKEYFKPIFLKIDKNIDMDKVHLVEFSWYNCSEAPDYYDEKDDEFYKPLCEEYYP